MNLNPGEVICDKCNGHGVMKHTVQKKKNFFIEKSECNKCHGEGKLDWIENIRGKEEPKIREVKYMTWGFTDDKPLKKSSEEIKESVDPYYLKKLKRKLAYEKKGGRF